MYKTARGGVHKPRQIWPLIYGGISAMMTKVITNKDKLQTDLDSNYENVCWAVSSTVTGRWIQVCLGVFPPTSQWGDASWFPLCGSSWDSFLHFNQRKYWGEFWVLTSFHRNNSSLIQKPGVLYPRNGPVWSYSLSKLPLESGRKPERKIRKKDIKYFISTSRYTLSIMHSLIVCS